MAVVQLQDSALFTVASNLYKRQFELLQNNVSFQRISDAASESLHVVYPRLPASIRENILKTIDIIGVELKNLSRAMNSLPLATQEMSHVISFDKVHWTPYFTINRMKTVCAMSPYSVTVDNICYPTWIEKCWWNLREIERSKYQSFFDKYSLFVFFHWICYNRHRHYFRDHLGLRYGQFRHYRQPHIMHHFGQYRDFYLDNSPTENVFRYLVIMSDSYFVAKFYPSLPTEVRRENSLVMATFIIRCSPSISYFDSSKTEIASTFLFLWQNLHHIDRMKIVQENFTRFFEFLLSFPGTDSLVNSVNWYRPSSSRKTNREFLEKAAAEIPPASEEYEKYRKVFHLLFNKVEMMLCEIDVVSLLEKLLSVKDIRSSVLMMKAMDMTKKKKVLDVLHKIWQDLWKESIDVETFMTFFIEVQSELLQEDAVKWN